MMVLNTEREAAVLRLLNALRFGAAPAPDDSETLRVLHCQLMARAQTRHEIHESIKRQGALI